VYKKSIKRLKKSKFLTDSIITITGSGVGKAMSFFCTLIIAKTLESNMYGVQTLFKSTITTISFLSIFGLQITITSFIAKKKRSEIAETISSSFIFIAITSFLFSIIYTGFVNKSFISQINNVYYMFLLIFIGSFASSSSLLFNGVLAGLGMFKQISIINLVSGLIAILILPYVAINFSLEGILNVLPFFLLFNSSLYIITLLSKNILIIKKGSGNFKELLKLTIPISLQEICFPLYTFFLNYIIISILGNEYLGIYSTAVSFYIMFLFVPGILRNVVLKHFSNKENESKKLQNKILNQSIVLNLILTIIPIILFLSSYKYIALFLGESYSQIKFLLIPMSVMAIISSISNPLYQYYIANVKNWKLFYMRFVRDLFTFTIIFIMLKFSFFTKNESLTYIMIISSITSAVLFLYMYFEKSKN
jgi:O-antigen/teichoic acid export membrane protein